MTKRKARRFLVLSGAGLICIMLLVTLASASTHEGKNVPAQHPDKATQVPVTTQVQVPMTTQAPTIASTTLAPVATQTTDSSSVFSSPAVLAAGLGLLSAAIGAGVTLYTHAKKK